MAGATIPVMAGVSCVTLTVRCGIDVVRGGWDGCEACDARHDARFYVHTFQSNDPYGSVSPHRVAASIADKTYEIGLVTRERVGC